MLTDSFEVVCENIPNRRLVNIDEWNLEDCDLPVSSHFYEWVIVVEVLLLLLLARDALLARRARWFVAILHLHAPLP